MKFKPLILVCGAGEMGTAVAHRLFRARFRVLLASSDDPSTLLRGNAYSQAAFTGSFEVEGVTSVKAVVTEALGMLDRFVIPLLTADVQSVVEVLNPDIIMNSCSPKTSVNLSIGDASLMIGMGEGHETGVSCDALVLTSPGRDLGRIIYQGATAAVHHAPRAEKEETGGRFRHTARSSGVFSLSRRLGSVVKEGDELARVDSECLCAQSDGVVCGHVAEGVAVSAGTVVTELDASGTEDHCYTISDVGRAVSGAALEAAVSWVADMGAYPSA